MLGAPIVVSIYSTFAKRFVMALKENGMEDEHNEDLYNRGEHLNT